MGGFSGDIESTPEYSEVHEFVVLQDTAVNIPTKLTTIKHCNIQPRTAASYAKTLFLAAGSPQSATPTQADGVGGDGTAYGSAAVSCVVFGATAAVGGSFIVELIGTIQ
jgi:hypothetical protein